MRCYRRQRRPRLCTIGTIGAAVDRPGTYGGAHAAARSLANGIVFAARTAQHPHAYVFTTGG